MSKRNRIIITSVGVLFFAMFLLTIHLANINEIPTAIKKLYTFPGGDKIGHVILLTLFAFFINMILIPKKITILGKKILMCEGDYDNIKLTTKEDMEYAKFMLRKVVD